MQAMHSILDRDVALHHLELANEHVLEGQQRVEAQLDLMFKLERRGHDTLQAKMLLEQFERTLALQIDTRDRIMRELAENKRIYCGEMVFPAGD
jgi:hypothetical protein